MCYKRKGYIYLFYSVHALNINNFFIFEGRVDKNIMTM